MAKRKDPNAPVVRVKRVLTMNTAYSEGSRVILTTAMLKAMGAGPGDRVRFVVDPQTGVLTAQRVTPLPES